MNIVINTQIRENYGAHAWDGQGECPQYWKFKGGNTFIVRGVTVEQCQSQPFWESLEKSIVSFSESWEEYIISTDVVDDVDFVESEFVEEWESPINLVFAGNQFLATRYTKFDWLTSDEFVAKLEQWIQENGNRENYVLMFEREDSSLITYKEWVAEAA